MSQLFDTPEDPWALPSPKQQGPWGASIQDQDNDDLLQSKPNLEDDDMATSPPQTTTASRLSPPIQQPQAMEGSIWGGDDAILGNPNSSSRTMALSDNADLDNDTTSGMAEFHQWSEAVRKTYSAITPDVIFISELPEKEGLLFKHTNYLIEHHVPLELDSTNSESSVPGERKVIRRYSDFVWLLEVLHKRYTFRLVPELPPKKLASSSDPLFLERRRRGLARFLNALVRHPVLRREQLVIMFLTVPTDLSGWRRQAQYDTSEEFVDRKSSPQFVKMWNSSKKELDAMMFSAEEELKNALENWNKVCVLAERLCVRQKQMGMDHQRLGQLLSGFRESTKQLYTVEDSRVPQINEGLREAAKHLDVSEKTLEEEAKHGDQSVLEEFKRHFDYLISLKMLLDRYHRLGGNTIEHLKKRLEQNEQKLAEIQDKPDVRGADVDRLTDSIIADSKEIARQTNRDWLIKENILSEFVVFQESQFQITRVMKLWVSDRLKFAEQNMDNWTGLSSVLQDMPLSRAD